jgi:cobalt/nickel transport system permease protein
VITALLTFAFVNSLFYGSIPQPYLLLLCAGLGIFLAVAGRHRHSPFIFIDVLAQNSGFKNVNPALKFWTLFALMIICVTSKNNVTGMFFLIIAAILATTVGRIRLGQYIHILALPVSFLLIGGLALLYEISPQPIGVLNLNIFGLWLSVSASAQARTSLIVARAFGAVSCLCLIGLTTPMPDIIGVLRRVRCPSLIIDLMYLIYRYIFILLSLHHEMRTAAKSRLGFRDYRTSMNATAQIYANLLARSYPFAGKNFDAMESRCYDTGIVFLESRNKITFLQGSVSAILVLISLTLSLLPL